MTDIPTVKEVVDSVMTGAKEIYDKIGYIR
jgi:hypothetical protein